MRFAKLGAEMAAGAALAIPGGPGPARAAGDGVQAEVAALIASAPAPNYTCVRRLHVDPIAGRSWSAYADGGGSRAEPWKSVEDADKAMDGGKPVLRAGDCVDLAPGTYELHRGLRLTHGGSRNAADGYVVYRSQVPGAAHLIAATPFYAMIDVKTAYVIFDGLELDGNKATARGEGVVAAGSPTQHHIVVENCRIHDTGGGGVQLNDSDYFWVVGNDIYRTASTNKFQESGISTYQAQAAQGVTPSPADDIPFHIVIVGNRSHDNVETYACTDAPGCHTDGNGVIVDKTRNVDRPGGIPYSGHILVAANIVTGNGGGGIHLYLSEHVTAAGNLAWDNHVDTNNDGTWRGELSNADSDDNRWIGNVGWATQGPGVLAHNSALLIAATGTAPPGRNVAWESNLTCGGDPSVYAHAPGLDPRRNRLNADPDVCRKAISAAR
ncbi:MAG TPA: right-handed parallel beta-helix repeat-containing protein [Allosphingosinicella sp.]|nr:right-handed parallel beta-helix repeat-containing protein [Allosphingosinicella sp.]